MRLTILFWVVLVACDPSGVDGPLIVDPTDPLGGDLLTRGHVPADAGPLPGSPDGGSLASAGDAVPRFATAFYFDLAHVERISRFRSGIGHDFSDTYETCRSMKHYICPNDCDGPNSPPPGS